MEEHQVFSGVGAWLMILLAAAVIFGLHLVLSLVTGKRLTFEEAVTRAFFSSFVKTVRLWYLALFAIPAYIASGIVLSIVGAVFGEPDTRLFLQRNFYIVFVPLYLVTLVAAWIWLRSDRWKRAPSPARGTATARRRPLRRR